MVANCINRAFGRVSLRGVARVRHAALTAASGSTGVRGGARALGWCDPGLSAYLAADICDCLSILRAMALHASTLISRDLSGSIPRKSKIENQIIESFLYISTSHLMTKSTAG